MPRKPGHHPPHHGVHSRVSVSPPEPAPSATTSGVPSYDPSAASGSHAGSAGDRDGPSSSGGAAGVDLLEYMADRLGGAFDPLPLDRSLAQQAQTWVSSEFLPSPPPFSAPSLGRAGGLT